MKIFSYNLYRNFSLNFFSGSGFFLKTLCKNAEIILKIFRYFLKNRAHNNSGNDNAGNFWPKNTDPDRISLQGNFP